MMNRRSLIGTAGAAGIIGLSGHRTAARSGEAGDDVATLDRPVERIVWARAGVDDLRPVEIDLPDSLVENTPTVTEQGRLRITAHPESTHNSHRQAWLIPGTEGFVDGEARTVWWPPSVVAGDHVAPQPGLVVRLTATGGLVADQSIMMDFTATNVASWSWEEGGGPGPSVRHPSHDALRTAPDRTPLIVGVARLDGDPSRNVFLVDRTLEFAEGDHFLVDQCPDETFNGAFVVEAVETSATSRLPGPAIVAVDPAQGAPVAPKSSLGRIGRLPVAQGIDPASIYPFNVALRVVGSKFSAKRWRVGDVEPSWDDPTWAVTIDTKGDRVPPPPSGGIGVMINHLHSGAWAEFGDVEFVRYMP